MSTMFDYSAGRIAPAALAAAGCQGVFRYVSTPGNPKNITKPELDELLAAELGVGLVYETTATWMLGGYNAGVAAARSAREQATAAGYSPAAALWFAADFDATPAQVATVIDTLHGCSDAEGSAARVAIYGGIAVCEAAAAAGFTHPWQTVAWSHGSWAAAATIRQTGQTRIVGGVQVDVNEVTGTGPWQQPQPEEQDMPYLISVIPDPSNSANKGPGVFSVDAGVVVHVDAPSLPNLAAKFGPPVVVSPAYYQALMAVAPVTALEPAQFATAVVSQIGEDLAPKAAS